MLPFVSGIPNTKASLLLLAVLHVNLLSLELLRRSLSMPVIGTSLHRTT